MNRAEATRTFVMRQTLAMMQRTARLWIDVNGSRIVARQIKGSVKWMLG
jgi:hypothetical protein